MDDDVLLRYSRQIMLPQIDIDGQEALGRASVLIVGAGGLGSAAALYLAAAGVGRLLIADDDRVDLSNLQRQILHGTDDIGRLKVDSAVDAIGRLNPHVQVIPLAQRLCGDALAEQVANVDLVVDGSDNLQTRLAVNAACVAATKPLVSGAAIRMEGQLMVYHPAMDGPCYRCLYPDADASELVLSCAEAGVLAPVVGVIGSLQAVEAIKCLTGAGRLLTGTLLIWDAREMEFQAVAVPRNPDCPVCAGRS